MHPPYFKILLFKYMKRKTEYARHKREKKMVERHSRAWGRWCRVCVSLHGNVGGGGGGALPKWSVDSAAVIDERVWLWKIYAGI